MKHVIRLAFLTLGLMSIACSAPQGKGKNDAMVDSLEPAIVKNGDEYIAPEPLTSFSDYILIKTNFGKTKPQIVSLDYMANDLANYDVVFVGEAHGHATNHYIQSKLFSKLYSKNNKLALSMEQFDRSRQNILNQYLAGEIGEETLIYEGKAWEHYRSSYRPLVEFAKHKGLSVIAAEIPANMVSCIGEQGPEFLQELNGKERGWIADKLHLQDGDYKDKFYAFMEKAAGHRVSNQLSPEQKKAKMFKRFAAQVSRDDTMAMSIVEHIKAHPDVKIMHINGSFHSAGLLGTPERVLLRNPDLKLANIHPVLVEDPDNPKFSQEDLKQGQYLLLLYPTPKRFVKMSKINDFIKRTKNKIDEDRCPY